MGVAPVNQEAGRAKESSRRQIPPAVKTGYSGAPLGSPPLSWLRRPARQPLGRSRTVPGADSYR